jgi:S1-C subfamily serine protease
VGVLSQIVDFGPNSFGLNLMMDAPIDPGDSGGPVLNADGLIVGMARAVRVQTTGGQRVVGTFYAVHADEIKTALPLLKKYLR